MIWMNHLDESVFLEKVQLMFLLLCFEMMLASKIPLHVDPMIDDPSKNTPFPHQSQGTHLVNVIISTSKFTKQWKCMVKAYILLENLSNST